MKKMMIGMVAVVAIALGLNTAEASAAWQTRTTWRWDPICRKYVPVVERVWLPVYPPPPICVLPFADSPIGHPHTGRPPVWGPQPHRPPIGHPYSSLRNPNINQRPPIQGTQFPFRR